MKAFLVYEAATGRIVGYTQVSRDEDMDANATAERYVLESEFVDADLVYVSGGAVVARPACPVTGSATGRVITLAGVPLGATVAVRGESYTEIVQDDPSGDMALTVPAGHWTVSCDPFPGQAYSQGFDIA